MVKHQKVSKYYENDCLLLNGKPHIGESKGMGYSRKKNKQTVGFKDILFWTPRNFLVFYVTSGKSRENKASSLETPQNFVILKFWNFKA